MLESWLVSSPLDFIKYTGLQSQSCSTNYTGFFFKETIISNRTNQCSGIKKQQKQKQNTRKVKNKTTSTIIYSNSFFKVTNPYSSVLLQFNNKISNKIFSCIFYRKRIVYTAGEDQIKYFFQNQLVKISFLLCKLLIDFTATAINYVKFLHEGS